MKHEQIKIIGAYEHNLKKINLSLNKYSFIVITGVSGSGKSSLAFDTIHKSGKKHYLETLQSSNKALHELLKEPKVERIENLGPTIALKQANFRSSPKATLGTETGIHPLLCALWSNEATLYCPQSHQKMQKSSFQLILTSIMKTFSKKTIEILSPIQKPNDISLNAYLHELRLQGFLRVRIGNETIRLEGDLSLMERSDMQLDLIVDRICVEKSKEDRIKSSLNTALQISKGLVIILFEGQEHLYSDALYSQKTKKYYKTPTPECYSFQSLDYACLQCAGHGKIYTFDEDKILEPQKSVQEDFCCIAPSYGTIKWSNIYENLARIYSFKTITSYINLSRKVQHLLLYGSEDKWLEMHFTHPHKGLQWSEYVRWEGIIPIAKKRLALAASKAYKDKIHALMHESLCPSCKGSRIQDLPSFAKIDGSTLHEFCTLEIKNTLKWIIRCEKKHDSALKHLFYRIKETLSLLIDLGLDYLFLDRDYSTLSTGEATRTKITRQIASKFSNTTYILDEPSIGLHPQDNQTLIHALKKLQKNYNTLIVVEHDKEIMLAADYIIDLGPSGGSRGGQIVFSGDKTSLLKANTLTADYLTKRKTIAKPPPTFKPSAYIHLKKCNQFNLKNFSLKIPMQCATVVTGVCGSGKSTLIFEVLYKALLQQNCKIDTPIDQVYCIDQSPVTKSNRSTLCTYIKVFDDIRDFFANLRSSQIRNFTKSHFSFNTKQESCSHCNGLGFITSKNPLIDNLCCPFCQGQQFSRAILEITYKDKNIADVLEMTVLEAYEHFESITPIEHKLKLLIDIGLEYLTLGQQTGSLSGGEAQRLKLSRTLVKKTKKPCLYLFDEPTTGLHFHDITKLVTILRKLVQSGHTVIVIEHNLDLIRSCDFLVELGPKGGEKGGELLYTGVPNKLPKTTPTGKFYHNCVQHKTSQTPQVPEKQQIECLQVSQRRKTPIDLIIPYNTITLLEGSRNAKKTTFAKETLYYSAYQAYYQTLSPLEKSLLKPLTPAKVDLINNLLPTIYCEKKEISHNPRSTLGTFSGIFDLLRVLWTHMAEHYCPVSHEKLVSVNEEFILETLLEHFHEKKCHILAPIQQKKGASLHHELKHFQSLGFTRIRINGTIQRIDELKELSENIEYNLELVIDCLSIKKSNKARLLESLKQVADYSNKHIRLLMDNKELNYYLNFCAPKSALSYEPLEEANFSFNDEKGMCQKCRGRGSIYALNLREDKTFLNYTPQSWLALLLHDNMSKRALKLITTVFKQAKCPLNRALKTFTNDQIDFVLDGKNKEKKGLQDKKLEFIGLHAIIKQNINTNFEMYELVHHLLKARPCLECQGSRLNPLARASRIKNKTIVQISQMPLDKLLNFINNLSPPNSLVAVVQKIQHELKTALSLELKSLSLSRPLSSLSSSQMQKFNLAKVLSAKLTNTLFIFDNPSHSLDQEDISLLKDKLIELKNSHNTILLISHEKRLKGIVEHTIDLEKDRKAEPLKSLDSHGTSKGSFIITNQRNKRTIELSLAGINLMQGSCDEYKTSLAKRVLKKGFDELFSLGKLEIPFTFKNHEAIKACLYLDSKHENQTSRSDVATFLGIAPKLRQFFSNLPSSKIKGLSPANFSYNHRLGMCKSCRGLGYESLYLTNNERTKKTCSECDGLKLNKISSCITYKGLSFFEILSKPIQELESLLIHERSIQNSCRLLKSFTLDNLILSTKLQSLSSCETSLVYLIDLLRHKKSNSLIILDNVTTSFDDATMNAFIASSYKLTQQGHTLLLLEKNPVLDQIKHNTIENRGFLTSKDL